MTGFIQGTQVVPRAPRARRGAATFWVQGPTELWTDDESYWRVRMPAKALRAAVRFVDQGSSQQVGPVAVLRSPSDPIQLRLLRSLKRRGTRVLIESDDGFAAIEQWRFALWNAGLYDTPLLMQQRLAHFEGFVEIADRCAQEADGVIASSPALAEYYRDLNESVFLCRNAIDRSDLPPPRRRRDGIFRVGFAGGMSHEDDAALIHDALEWASRKRGTEAVWVGDTPLTLIPWGLRLQLFGVGPRDDPVDKLFSGKSTCRASARAVADVERYQNWWRFPFEHRPWTNDLLAYRRNLQVLDVGLCPIQPYDKRFGPWRSDVKVMEYAMAGVLPICSAHRAYDEWRGLVPMAENAQDFLRLVKWAASHRPAVKRKLSAIRRRIFEQRMIETEAASWRRALRG